MISWSNPAAITYGTPLSGTQLNATANVAGSFAYAPVAGTVLNAGNGQTLYVDFTPTDTVTYSNASKNVTVDVLRATATVSVSNIPGNAIVGGSLTPAYSYTGDGMTSVTSSTLGTCNVSGTVVSYVTSGTCIVVAHATAGVNYAAANGSPQSFTIAQANVDAQLSALIALVKSMKFAKGREDSLLDKLKSPLQCDPLKGFSNLVPAQTGKDITVTQAKQSARCRCCPSRPAWVC